MQKQKSAQQKYLQAEVHTATPQKLQLMLVEAAIKNIHRTKQAWLEQRYDEGVETLIRAQDIVAEILCSLDVKSNEQIAKQLASIYLFIFRRLAEGGMAHDGEKLDEALRVLNAERETWRLVCEKFGSTVEQPTSETPVNSSSSGDTVSFSSGAAGPASYAAPGDAKVLVPPVPPKPTTFARPGNAPFAQGVRPLGASPIQTSSSLATPPPPAPPKDGTPKTPPTSGSTSSGAGWDA